jgi:hypothetical protein
MRFLNENVLFLTIIVFILGSVLMCAYGIEENEALSRGINTPNQPHIVSSAAISLEINLVNEPDNNRDQAQHN